MKPLRLLAFSHSANFGGSEQVLVQLVRELTAERAVSCTVVVPADGPLTEALRSAGAAVWVWATSWWCRPEPVGPEEARWSLAAGAAEVLRGLPRARDLDPDAVLSVTTVIPWGALTAALLDKPHLWYVTDFGGAADYPPHYFLGFEEVRRALQTGADRQLVVSHAVRDRLFYDASEQPPVVYPHLPLPPSRPSGRVEGRVGRTVLAVFGVVRPTKGHWEAVEALAELARRGLEAELVVVGYADEGVADLREHARALGVESRLRVIGSVPDQHPWMAGSDIVLVPSHEETFSLVCLEAHLHAKPLVATRVGGILEFVHDGVNGLTVPPAEPEALASAVERLVREPDLARRLAGQGRRQALERFTADHFSGEVRRLLEEAVAEDRQSGFPAPLAAPLEALAAELQELDRARQGALTQLGRTEEALDAATAKLAQAEEERDLTADELARTEEERKRMAARLTLAEEERDGAAARLDDVSAALRTERERREGAEERASALAADQARIARTRAWRLVQVYWRLAGRLRR